MFELIDDQKARQEAIDPSQSFIVQAPAGSGKTELLTQRFLHLLSYVKKNPEEIVAITFTRKAAAEMRQRIISALNDATKNKPPKEPHKQTTWRIAKKALKRDQQCNWQLQKNPNRLRILTIDALSAYLIKQMPISAQLNPQLNITENPFPYYREAAEQILLTLPLEALLLHLDNRVELLENLLVEILSKREQWLPHITGHQHNTSELRLHMENALQNVLIECMQTANAQLTNELLSEYIPLADFAGHYCAENDPENPIAHCKGLTTLSTSLDAFPLWLGIAHLVLTQKGEWRKSVTKRQGFPAKSELKPQMLEFLNTLSKDDLLKSQLYDIMQCPPLCYDTQQWKIIENLITVLPRLAAQLNIIFSRENVTDFVELNLAASRALGDEENPTDLAMHLDYRINHLLIDEFQDTSLIQFQLIEKLIAGWTPQDGRTLFLVGDPMQSIYRFRNAEVGLFLRVQQQGINNIMLKKLSLKQNFRSSQSLVEWNNQNFQIIFPSKSNITEGGIPYSPAYTNSTQPGKIQWHPSINDDGTHESDCVVRQIQTLQKISPNDTIAVLVRSRTHLYTITQCLHQKNIAFQAIDLEPLAQLIEIQDIHALTRALLHRADRIAWLAILRAPYCGLLLADLMLIAEASKNNTIWTTLKNYKTLETLSEDAQLRLAHCVPALFNAVENIGRLPFSQLLRKLWLQLDAPKTLEDDKQYMNIDSYLKQIESLESQNLVLSLFEIEERLKSLYAKPNPNADSKLQIMTIHKAKGLEFDHVLMPGLHRKSPNDSYQILKWLERPNLFGTSDLILAPIKATDQKTDPIYAYLRRIDKIKSDYECARLLYVATTRAKKSLYLFANIIKENDEIKAPVKDTFLNLLWKDAKPYFLQKNEVDIQKSEKKLSKTLHRFTKTHLEHKPIPPIETVSQSKPVNISLQKSTPRYIGTIIHQALEYRAKTGLINSKQWSCQLKQLGLRKDEFETALQTIQCAIETTQQDPRGQWILSNQHEDAHCEYALSFFTKNQLNTIIIDRCFIDQGIRWIIDYKTGSPTPEELEQYRQQLELYAKVFQQREERPTRIALYFPLTSNWVEWEYVSLSDLSVL